MTSKREYSNEEIEKIKEKATNDQKNNIDKILPVLKYLQDNNIKTSTETENLEEEKFTKSYYSTVLRIANLPKNAQLILSKIHAELCNKKGVFYDNVTNRTLLEDTSGYSRSMINKGMQALNKPLAILNNQPAIIKTITRSVKGRIIPNSFIINPYLYSLGEWHETQSRRIIVSLAFSELKNDMTLSIKQIDEETGEIILDTDDFNLDKVLESMGIEEDKKETGKEKLDNDIPDFLM